MASADNDAPNDPANNGKTSDRCRHLPAGRARPKGLVPALTPTAAYSGSPAWPPEAELQ